MNEVLKKTLYCQITLLEACRCLVREVRTFKAKLLAEEITSITLRSRIFRFATLLGKITIYAIDIMAPE
jgi:hypothetical protein